jgi:two-component system sensor histidine kinase RegB
MPTYNSGHLSTLQPSTVKTPMYPGDLQPVPNTQRHTWFRIFRICVLTLHIIALLIAHYWYHLDLPYYAVSFVLALIPITQVIAFHPEVLSGKLTNFSHQHGYKLVLLTDTVILSVLLGLSGGPMNPFSIGYLVFVVIAAVTLNDNWVWLITCTTLAGFTAISYYHIPLHQLMHHSDIGLSLHLKGMLVAYGFTALILSLFLRRIVKEHTDLREQYLQIKGRLEKIASVTTITADTVHQLRTPLATMKLIVDELSFNLSSTFPRNPPSDETTTNQNRQDILIEDIALLSDQIDSCNALLTNMCYQNGNIHGAEFSEENISSIWNNACADLDIHQIKLIDMSPSDTTIVAPQIPLARALKGLVMNAVQAVTEKAGGNQGKVRLYSEVCESNVSFIISDNGPGMDTMVRSMCHHPFFTTKSNGTALGLGLFVANTVALQLGGRLTVDSTKGKGTRVAITIPRNMSCKITF